MINTPVALASSSPRRLELLRVLDLDVRVIDVSYPESIDPSWPPEEVPVNLARMKNKHSISNRQPEEVLLTADTIVLHHGDILHKPESREEALACLQRLSDSCHTVITGVCLSTDRQMAFSVSTMVWLEQISSEAMEYYIDTYKPYDKAGGYGIQEWIGWSHISRIEGSYSNVMGLPTCEVYKGIRGLGG